MSIRESQWFFHVLLCLTALGSANMSNAMDQTESLCEDALSPAPVSRVLTGPSIEELPEILEERWQSAKDVCLPFGRVDAIKNAIPWNDTQTLRWFLKKGHIGAKLGVGWVARQEYFVELIWRARIDKRTMRKVWLLVIQGRRYRVQVESNIAQVDKGRAYRDAAIMEKIPEVGWEGVVAWKDLL